MLQQVSKTEEKHHRDQLRNVLNRSFCDFLMIMFVDFFPFDFIQFYNFPFFQM